MTAAKLIFFLGALIIFYSYIGYGMLVFLLLQLKKIFQKPVVNKFNDFTPPVTLIVAAYNEQDFIVKKIENTLAIDYPADKIQMIFITDGSSDNTPSIVKQYPAITLLHQAPRNGKVAAIHRAISFVNSEYIIFSDANTLLNKESVKNIMRHYSDPLVGGVAGEKKILVSEEDAAAGQGEGLYWKYESFLKKMDSDFYTVVGAAGELFSVRKKLYEFPGKDILLDDFIISLRVCQNGYRVVYEPQAYALESASLSVKEERKRKIRISAGGFQSILILSGLLNIFKYPKLSFQYISHRVLRWTLCPLFLPLIFLSNIFIVFSGGSIFYILSLVAQFVFYTLAWAGYILSEKPRSKVLYVPYYFTFINVSIYIGFSRFIKKKQTVLWDKADRGKELYKETETVH